MISLRVGVCPPCRVQVSGGIRIGIMKTHVSFILVKFGDFKQLKDVS